MFRLCFSPGETVEAIIKKYLDVSHVFTLSLISLFFYYYYYYNVLVHCLYIYVVFALDLSR